MSENQGSDNKNSHSALARVMEGYKQNLINHGFDFAHALLADHLTDGRFTEEEKKVLQRVCAATAHVHFTVQSALI